MTKVSELVSQNVGNAIINSQTWGNVLINVKNSAYGAKGDGVTDDTAAISAAVNALVTAGGGVLRFPSGTYKISATLPIITVACIIEGNGRETTRITMNSLTQNVWNVQGNYVTIRDMTIDMTAVGTPASSTAIFNSGSHNVFERLKISSFSYGIRGYSGGFWGIKNCYLINNAVYQAYVQNVPFPDGGDQYIMDCVFDSTVNALAAIRHESGGGLRIINNKIFRNQYGYDLQIVDGANTSILIIEGNSIEGQTKGAIRLGRLGTTGNYKQMQIVGNQFNIVGTPDPAYETVGINAGVSDITFEGNNLFGLTSKIAVNLYGGNGITIVGNNFDSFLEAIKIADGINGVRVGVNQHINNLTLVEDLSSALFPTLIDHYYRRAASYSSTVTYTNVFYINMKQFRVVEIELFFEGILNGVSSIYRTVKKVVGRDTTACGVAAVTDIAGAAVFDLNFDTTTESGSVYVQVRRNAAAGGTSLDMAMTLKVNGSPNKVAIS